MGAEAKREFGSGESRAFLVRLSHPVILSIPVCIHLMTEERIDSDPHLCVSVSSVVKVRIEPTGGRNKHEGNRVLPRIYVPIRRAS